MFKKYIEKIVWKMLNEKMISCDECKLIVNEPDAQKVEIRGYLTRYKYYCPAHKK